MEAGFARRRRPVGWAAPLTPSNDDRLELALFQPKDIGAATVENIEDASWAGALQQIVRRNRQNRRSLSRVLLGFHLLGGNPEILVDRGLDLGGVHSPAS